MRNIPTLRPACTCTAERYCRPCVLIATREDYAALWDVLAGDVAAIRAKVTVSRPKIRRPQPQRTAVAIPDPPQLVILPTSDRALVTVVVGKDAQQLFAASGKAMSAYARRVGADLVVLDWPGNPDWPISAKFAIGRVLAHYARVAFVDADVLLRPDALNLFEQCSADEFGAVDELQTRHPNARREYKRFRADIGQSGSDVEWYLNTGVMVVGKTHQPYLLPPDHALPTYHCAEQDSTNARLYADWQAGRVKVKLLDRRCNWQSWQDPEFKTAPPDAVLHWSGQHMKCRRCSDMRKWAHRYGML